MSKFTHELQPNFHASLSNRPVSANLESVQRANVQNRPASEILSGHYKSPEAEAIDRWFEDLSYYERTLEQMAKAKLDDNFKEELKAIEQWFSVLTDAERTTALYSLLQHTTQLQIRFFITVLQQMVQKDPVTSQSSHGPNPRASMPPGIHVPHGMKGQEIISGNVGIGRSTRRVYDRYSAPTPEESFSNLLGYQNIQYTPETAEDSYKRMSGQSSSSNHPPSVRTSLQIGRPKTPVDSDPINSANWSMMNSLAPGHERSSLKIGNGSVASIVTSPRSSGTGLADDLLLAEMAKLAVGKQGYSPLPLSGPSSPISANYAPSASATAIALAQAQTASLLNNQQQSAKLGGQHPGSGWGHVDIAPMPKVPRSQRSSPRSRSPHSPGYANSDYSDSFEYESGGDNSSNGVHPGGRTRSAPNPGAHKEKGKIPENIDLEALKDIPAWLRSLRLHKYTPIFENMDWKEMVQLTDEQLSEKGVAALGARRKMLKVFDMVLKDLESKVLKDVSRLESFY